MNQQPLLPMASSGVAKDNNRLFSGIWIRWSVLTQAERVVCTCITLIPLWWLWGWSYLLVVLAASIVIHRVLHQGSLRLQNPSWVVILTMVHGLYGLVSTYVYGSLNNLAFGPREIFGSFNAWFAPAVTLWYIQSHKIRVRPKVVAWAFSVVVVLMLIFWLVIYCVWRQADYTPTRSLFGLISGKGEEFVNGVGNSNFLMPYFPRDVSLPGLVRYVFFFHGPESLAVLVSFVVLLAVDILDRKNRLWVVLLISGATFVLLVSGTRSAWITLPVVLTLRYLVTAGKASGPWFLCAAIGFVSFVTLSLPPVTNLIFHSATSTAEATSNFRGDSTEVRGEIYIRTLEGILDASDMQLFFGHVQPGETVLPGYAPAMVGTHSFILGDLLYQRGLLGTAIFLTYWVALIRWFYNTRTGRPICCLLVFVQFSLSFAVMAFESTVMPIILICATLGATTKLTRELRYKYTFN